MKTNMTMHVRLQFVPIFILLSLAPMSEVTAQNAKEVFTTIVASFLEDGDIIRKQADIDAMPNKKDKEIKAREKAQKERDYFIEKFRMPSAFTDFKVERKFKYEIMPLSSLGSFMFNSAALPGDTREIVDQKLPLLLMTNDFSQVAIEDPSSNSYDLHINLLSYMNWVLDGNLNAEYAGVAKAKAEVALRKTFQDKKSLSVAYGYFQNRLAKIFDEVERTEKISDFRDFAPLFDVWVQQSVNPDIAQKYVIDGFNGLVVESSTNTMFLGNTSFNAAAQLSLNVPFLRASANTEYTWKSEREMRRDVKTVGVYFRAEPNFVKVPSAEKIYKVWQYVTASRNRDVIYKDGSILTISNFMNDEPVVKVLFGPLPGPEYKSDLGVRISSTDDFSKDFLLEPKIQDLNRCQEDTEDNMNQGLYYIPIILHLDKDKIRTSSKISPNLVINASIEIFHKKECKVDNKALKLSANYPIYISLNTGPGIMASPGTVTVDQVKKEQSWKFSVTTTEAVHKLDFVGFNLGVTELESYGEALKLKSTLIPEAGNDKKWQLTTTGKLLDGSKDYGAELSPGLRFDISHKNNGMPPLNRTAKTLMPIKYDNGAQPEVYARTDIAELIPFISDTVKLLSGEKAVEVLKNPNSPDSLKIKTYDELLRRNIIFRQNKIFKMLGKKSNE